MNIKKDRAMGAIMGGLIGDALGIGPHWYYDFDKMKEDYGEWIDVYTEPKPARFHAGLQAGENSQTGQVVIMLMESIFDKGIYIEDDFSARLDSLLNTLDGTKKGGRYTDIAMRDVWKARKIDRLDWSKAGSYAPTAEAAIRTPVLAARFYEDINLLVESLKSNVFLTHRDPFIASQSVSFGLITATLIDGCNLVDAPKEINKKASSRNIPMTIDVFDSNVKKSVSFMDTLLQPSYTYAAVKDSEVGIESPKDLCRLFGLSCPLGFMLPAAYYFVSHFENDFYNAVMSALNGGGSNMARAALTGALSGAQAGLSNIPDYLVRGLHDNERLLEMADKICSCHGKC